MLNICLFLVLIGVLSLSLWVMPRFPEIPPSKWREYERLVDVEGWSRRAACRELGMSERGAQYHDRGRNVWLQRGPARLSRTEPGARVIVKRAPVDSSGAAIRSARLDAGVPAPIPFGELGRHAAESLEDFEKFRLRYFGHVSMPWQVETAHRVVGWLASPETVMVVENVFPGAGKSTLRHDVAAWVTARNRRIRGLFGSRKEANAGRDLMRLRRSLERTSPPKAKPFDLERGLAVDAEACLAVEFGSFKPLTRELWTQGEFVVAQFNEEMIEEREPTWSCYGIDSGLLSNRFEFAAWDDVDDKATLRTMSAVEGQRQTWDDECETRVEQGGLFWVIQQRLAAHDTSRYCLDKRVPAEESDDDEEVAASGLVPVYKHVVFKAHYEDRCAGDHGVDAEPYPAGCLLDPKRGRWGGPNGLRAISMTKPRNFRLSYQQEDVEADDVLVPEVWISGGTDPETGELLPGCWDNRRDLCELPAGLAGPLFSIATVDPSPTKMWALQWWIHAPDAANQHFLMDLERRAMAANELLDWDANRGEFYGLMETWQARSVELGVPIKVWIVEVNAAQRFLLAYDHVRRWMAKWGVQIVPHTTSARKLDEQKGPWIIRDHFRYGRIRLPGRNNIRPSMARVQSMKLVDEVTRFPNPGVTDDQVYACWFYIARLPAFSVQSAPRHPSWRPSWVRQPA